VLGPRMQSLGPRSYRVAAIGNEGDRLMVHETSRLQYGANVGFWCIQGFRVSEDSLPDRSPQAENPKSLISSRFLSLTGVTRGVSATELGLLSADAPEPFGSARRFAPYLSEAYGCTHRRVVFGVFLLCGSVQTVD
jgi:hypothetical protein